MMWHKGKKMSKKNLFLFITSLFLLGAFFQNCSKPPIDDGKRNPNKSPLSENGNSSLVSPGTIQTKVIDGVDVAGFDTGTWMYVFVDDQCIVARKDVVQNTPFYFLDPYLKRQFDFNAAVGKYNVSMITFQLQTFISKEDFENALALDNCATASYLTANAPEAYTSTPPNMAGGSTGTWALMGLDDAVLQSLLTLNKSTKVNVGISSAGFNPNITPALPLSSGAAGLPQTDSDSAGTMLASVIAIPKSGNGVQGVADGVAQLIPVSMPANYESLMFSSLVFSLIKQTVNRGSDVLVLPLWKKGLAFCDPLIGQAIFYAIERGVTVVIPAGKGTTLDNDSGEIVGPRDFSLFQTSNTAQVACWGRYFRGAIAVGSRTKNSTVEIAPFSNYGVEGVELLAPGKDVVTVDKLSHVVLTSGTEISAALTGGAIAHIISFYKSKGWYYSPWLVEDTLMNGSATATNLPLSGVAIRKNKILDFKILKDFITSLNSGTEESARLQATDNPEAGQNINLGSVPAGERPMKLDVFTKQTTVYVKDRNQMQAVFYYLSGAVKVVTDQITWSSSDPINFPIDNQGIVRPKIAGTFTITGKDPTTHLTNSYTATAVDIDTVGGESAKLVRLELRDMWSSTHSVEASSAGYKMLTPYLYVDVWAVYENGISRKVTDNSVFTVFLDGNVIGGEYIQTFATATYFPKYGFFRGGRTHDLQLFYRGFQQTLKIQMPAFTFNGWSWPYNVTSSTYNKPIVSFSDNAITLYNIGLWMGIQYKIPKCQFLGAETDCPATNGVNAIWGCSSSPCELLPTTTLPQSGLQAMGGVGNGASVGAGDYTVDQQYVFYGNGLAEPKRSSLAVKVIEAPKVKVIQYAGWVFSLPELSSSPGTSVGTVQLAPVCSGMQGLVFNQNVALGIEEYFRRQMYDSVSEVSISSGTDVFTGYKTDQTLGGILITEPVSHPKMFFKLTDLNISTTITGPDEIISAPMDSRFNLAEAAFGAANLNTPTSLPALPPVVPKDPSCLLPARANGSHSGSGTQMDPYVVCTWGELKQLPTMVPPSLISSTYMALGADLNLAAEPKVTADLHNIRSFSGRNHRIMGADFLDSENYVSLMTGINEIHDLVFSNNNLTGRTTHLLYGVQKAWNIYAYDNLLAGEYVALFYGPSYVRHVFTKNQIRYASSATGITQNIMATVLESFTQDDVRYTGLPSGGSFYGVASSAAASGSKSVIIGGSYIGGVANTFCYKCYSEVNITTTNHIQIGGIMATASLVGTLEVGKSKATILVAGTGVAGGLIGFVESRTNYVPIFYSLAPADNPRQLNRNIGHNHITNSEFTGTISGTGFLGAAIGEDLSPTDTYFSNSQFNGTVEGAGMKGSLVGHIKGGQCVSTIDKVMKTKNVTLIPTLPVVGYGNKNIPVTAAVGF